MIGYLAGLLTGVSAAAGGVALRGLMRRRRVARSLELSDEDRTEITDAFAVHAGAVQKQVSTYADVLAEGDPLLRERLRRFEVGTPS